MVGLAVKRACRSCRRRRFSSQYLHRVAHNLLPVVAALRDPVPLFGLHRTTYTHIDNINNFKNLLKINIMLMDVMKFLSVYTPAWQKRASDPITDGVSHRMVAGI